MSRSDMPISLMLAMAMMSQNREMVDKVVCGAFEEITHRYMDVVNSYDKSDLPFLVATMLITGNSLKNLLNEDGLGIVNQLVSHTACMTIDAEEFRRQMKDNGNEEK